MRIVVDMNLSPRWAVRLSGLGHDAVHWSAVGDPRATDESVLAWAHQSALERGAVLVIDRRGARVRQLPFRR